MINLEASLYLESTLLDFINLGIMQILNLVLPNMFFL